MILLQWRGGKHKIHRTHRRRLWCEQLGPGTTRHNLPYHKQEKRCVACNRQLHTPEAALVLVQ